MEWIPYQPRTKSRNGEQVTITKHRSFVFNTSATAHLQEFGYVRVFYKPSGEIQIQPSKEPGDNALKIHFSENRKVCAVSASGLLETLHYQKTLPKRRFDLLWDDAKKSFEFTIDRDLLTGRRRRRKAKITE